MAKKKKRGGPVSNLKAHEQAARRRKVAKMRACGYSMPEIAHKLGVSVPTISRDMRDIELQYWEHTQKDQGKVIALEVERLEHLRTEALRCFYTAANRHGERNQTGYLTAYARLTEQLHRVLHLTDPQVGIASAQSVQGLQPITLVVKTREEAAKFAPGGRPDMVAIGERFANLN